MGALADIDRSLAEWTARLERIDDNLVSLEEEATYEVMTTEHARAALTGETRQVFERAANLVAQLWGERDRLEATVERARELRAEIGLFASEEKLTAARHLLFGASIVLGSRATNLEARTLLGAASVEETLTPMALVARMTTGFEKAKRAIAEIRAAWTEVETALATLERRSLRLLERLADVSSAELGAASAAATDARTAIVQLRGEVVTDPLGARARTAALARTLQDLERAVDEAAAREGRVRQALARTSERLVVLQRSHQRATDARAEAARDFVGADASLPPLLAAQALEDLAAWRAKLAETVAAGRFAPAEVGLTRWQSTVEAHLAATTRALDAALALPARRDELRGRLSARRAQAASRTEGDRAAAGVALEADLARRAYAILAEQPLPLDTLEEAVAAHERAVISLLTR